MVLFCYVIKKDLVMFFLDNVKNSNMAGEAEKLENVTRRWWELYTQAKNKDEKSLILAAYRKEVKKVIHNFLNRVGYEVSVKNITIETIKQFSKLLEQQLGDEPYKLDAESFMFLNMYSYFFRNYLNLREFYKNGYTF